MRRANNGERLEQIFAAKLFGSAQIDQIRFSSVVNDRVFRLHIAVDYIVGMQILERKEKATKVVAGDWLAQGGHFADHIEHLLPS